MGTQTRGFGETESLEKQRIQKQKELDAQLGTEIKRKLGSFATPFALAREIVEYGLSLQNEKPVSFIEPALGTGAIYSALLSSLDERVLAKAVGIEISWQSFDMARQCWAQTGLELLHEDALHFVGEKGNLLISNPPYVRHHLLEARTKTELKKKVKELTGLSVSGLAGLYVYFVLLSSLWVEKDGLCGWLIPSEFMEVEYGKALKHFLLNNVDLIAIHRYPTNTSKFEDALVSSCVVWFKNSSPSSDRKILFSFGEHISAPNKSQSIERKRLDPEEKWTHLLDESEEIQDYSCTLGDFFKVQRGIATGDNNFFILSKEKIEKEGMDFSLFTPVLPAPRSLKVDRIDKNSKGWPKLDSQLFLLNCRLDEEQLEAEYLSLWKYLETGKESTAKRYLCKSRKKWYYQEKRKPAPFLLSYMGRGKKDNPMPFRMILNKSDAIATNAYLMLYPTQKLANLLQDNPNNLELCWEFLKDLCSDSFLKKGRSYGGGLKKIEPKELAKVPCPDLISLLTEARLEY